MHHSAFPHTYLVNEQHFFHLFESLTFVDCAATCFLNAARTGHETRWVTVGVAEQFVGKPCWQSLLVPV